ncbi:uncharacterized protein LOC119098301 [Pollicipes pollicipes]|uniref:uncharacterized protein LOC119098301 n=1 Tax=Pollicipes pollicipes TaxID=41117 RepID=UPI0018857D31|nr:uncharacterized protein LOC119098301 [Pollicipes pollicipes]
MDFDEDDFIFIESADAPVESLKPLTPSKAGRYRPQPAYAKRTGVVDDAEPSSSKPKLKRSFRTSPEVPGPDVAGQSRPGKRRKKGADPDSEEERWLDALEEGKLEQVDDELRKMRNPLLMTARQRALLEKRSGDDSLESFPGRAAGRRREPPKPRLCGVAAARNLRRYSCARTGVSLCSLRCFNANAALRRPPASRS